jgi:hypothetical protein
MKAERAQFVRAIKKAHFFKCAFLVTDGEDVTLDRNLCGDRLTGLTILPKTVPSLVCS